MNARTFVDHFIEAELDDRRPTDSNVAWTMHLSRSAAIAAHKIGWSIATKAHKDRAPGENWKRAEYLALDAMCWNPTAADHECPITQRLYPYPRPTAIVEFENDPRKALYDYWKLLCVRSDVRLLTVIAVETAHDALAVALGGLREEHADVQGVDVVLFGPVNMANGSSRWRVFDWSVSTRRFMPT